MTLPADVRQYPDAIAQALSQLRLVGVNGPYSVVLGADAYTALAETVDNGYPVLEHVKKLVKDEIIWAPAIDGAFVLTTRGGDFDLHIGQDVSIGYLSHTDSAVRLYLQETMTFLMLTSEAAVALAPPASEVETLTDETERVRRAQLCGFRPARSMIASRTSGSVILMKARFRRKPWSSSARWSPLRPVGGVSGEFPILAA